MKVVLLGDSITQGLGSKTVNFQRALQERMQPEDTILNWALTGTTVDYIQQLLRDFEKERPDVAVILYGNVDAQIKPNRTGKIFPRIPGRLGAENGCMILPRPFYSHRPLKRLLQRLENLARTILRKLVYAVDGTEQWMPIDPFMKQLGNACQELCALGVRPVICSTVYLDERLFPGSNAEYQKYNARMQEYALEEDIAFLDIYNVLRQRVEIDGWKSCYNEDHFHPNGSGYLLIAEQIAAVLRSEAQND